MLVTGRDPFHSIRREVVPCNHLTGPSCAWCGGHGAWYRAETADHSPDDYRLYRYRVDPDSGRSGYVAGGKLFCSIGCARSYLGD